MGFLQNNSCGVPGAEEMHTETSRNMGALGTLYKMFSFLSLVNVGFAPLLCS